MKSTTTKQKKLKNFILPLFCGMLLLSCEGGRLDTDAVSRTVQVNAVREGIQTRVTDGMWGTGDAIGLFMKPAGATLSESSVLAHNVKYITTGGADFSPDNEAERILFPFNASDVDFIGYYPFTTEIIDFNFPVDVSDQSDLSAISLLYSNNATRLNSKSPYANLLFSHQLTKIILNIRPENTVSNLSGLTARLTNTGTSALFSLIDGTLSEPTTHGNISFNITADGRFAQAIVLPSNDLSGKHLVLEIGETQYVFALSSSVNITSFNKSTRYTFNIMLNPQGTSVLTEGSITDWIDGPSEDLILDPDENGVPDMTKGTRGNPFTPDEARLNQGRTNVWIEGYIVGFYSTANTLNNFVNDAVGVDGAEASQTNLALASDIYESVARNTFPVQIPSTVAFRRPLNLRENPENFRRRILIRGDIGSFVGVGLINMTDFEFIDTP